MPQQRLQSEGGVSVEQESRERQAKKNRHGSRALSVNGRGIATRLILAPDASIVQMVGVENPARWPGLGEKPLFKYSLKGFLILLLGFAHGCHANNFTNMPA